MDNQPPVDRTILLPTLIGAFSIFGILIILLIGRVSASRASLSEAPTETPFKYIFLGTEPFPSAESTVATEPGFFEETSTPFGGFPSTATLRPALTFAVTPTGGTLNVTPSPTGSSGGPPGSGDDDGPPVNNTSPATTSTNLSPNPGSGPPPLNPGTYDDAHPYLAYDGPGWAPQTGIAGAYQGTLHVSGATGSSFRFSFIGTELRLFYQGGSGVITIKIDTQEYTLDESDAGNGNEWVSSPPLPNATHMVTVTHRSGGAVNIDYIIIPAIATPTPTPTRTP